MHFPDHLLWFLRTSLWSRKSCSYKKLCPWEKKKEKNLPSIHSAKTGMCLIWPNKKAEIPVYNSSCRKNNKACRSHRKIGHYKEEGEQRKKNRRKTSGEVLLSSFIMCFAAACCVFLQNNTRACEALITHQTHSSPSKIMWLQVRSQKRPPFPEKPLVKIIDTSSYSYWLGPGGIIWIHWIWGDAALNW